jgi:hypothetical protein
VDMRYEVPLPRLAVPYLGGPILVLRHRIGSAGIQTLPRLIQNVGVSAALSFARVEYMIDPATRKGHFSAAFSFTRYTTSRAARPVSHPSAGRRTVSGALHSRRLGVT